MKQLLILLAATGLLYSCSKETPAPPVVPNVDNQEAPEFAGNNPATPTGSARLNFTAELEELEDSKVDLDGKPLPESRGVDAGFGRDSKVLSLKLKEDTPGSGKVKAFLYFSDATGSAFVERDVNVTDAGKGISFDHALNKPSGSTILDKMIDKNFAGVKLTVVVGATRSGQKVVFQNKGAAFTTGTTSVDLPNNYVLLKSEGNVLTATPGRPYVGAHNIKLKMQGYMLAVRIRNTFPERAVKYTWAKAIKSPFTSDFQGNEVWGRENYRFIKRPALEARFNIKELSAVYQNVVSVGRDSRVSVSPDAGTKQAQKDQLYNYNTQGLVVARPERGDRGVRRNPVNIGQNGVFKIPVATGAARTNVSAKDGFPGEPVIIFYCPDPKDSGAIGYEPAEVYFYDGSVFSSDLVTKFNHDPHRAFKLKYADNWVKKDGAKQPSVEGKVYPILLKVVPHTDEGETSFYSLLDYHKAFRSKMFKDYSVTWTSIYNGYTPRLAATERHPSSQL
jgi:hypothetical protein